MPSRVILITGAAGGIGRATAARFARDRQAPTGLFLSDRDEAGLDRVVRSLEGEEVEVATLAGDLAEAALPGRLVAAAVERFGRLDVIVSNAGTTRRGGLSDQSLEDWDHVFAVNARATWLLAQAAGPHLRSSRGTLVAVASIAGLEPNPGTGFYSASKAALLSLVAQLALEWAGDGVRVNAVSPGATLTGLNEAAYRDLDFKARRASLIPVGRIAEPDEIAAAIAFLAGEAAAFCHGHNLVVDGGLLPAVLAHGLPPIARA